MLPHGPYKIHYGEHDRSPENENTNLRHKGKTTPDVLAENT